jgi:hypothetical protein
MPCKCIILSSLFISYTEELKKEMEETQRIAAEEFNLKVYTFPDMGPDFSKKGRMPSAFGAISKADAAIILLASKFSPRVYAELIEIMFRKNREYVFVYVREEENRDQELIELLKEIGMIHRYSVIHEIEHLKVQLRKDLGTARDISIKLGR